MFVSGTKYLIHASAQNQHEEEDIAIAMSWFSLIKTEMRKAITKQSLLIIITIGFIFLKWLITYLLLLKVVCRSTLWIDWWLQSWEVSHYLFLSWFDWKYQLVQWWLMTCLLLNYWGDCGKTILIRASSSSASTLAFRVKIVVISEAFTRPAMKCISSHWIKMNVEFCTYLWFIQATVTSPPTILK